jgi:hypothetical protein
MRTPRYVKISLAYTMTSTCKADPLPSTVLQFANLVYRLCADTCVTGSAPLAKYLHVLSTSADPGDLFRPLENACQRSGNSDVDIFISNQPHLLVADRECHKGMVGRELSEARIALVVADMTDVGYRQDRLIDHLTFMAQDLYGITKVDLYL